MIRRTADQAFATGGVRPADGRFLLRSAGPLPATRPWSPARLGVISGLGYRNRRGGLERVSRFLDGVEDVRHEITRTPADVARVLDEYRRDGVDIVAVNGGDGTLAMVLTRLLRRGGRMPLLAVLAGGRTNMSAGDIGLRGDQVGRLRRLLDIVRSGDVPGLIERPVMHVRVSPEHEDEFGLFFGAASIYHGSVATWSYRQQSSLPGMRTGFGTGVSVLKLLGKHLLGQRPFDPSQIRVRLDGEEIETDRYFILFATTLERMALGLRPFWGEGNGAIRFTAVAHENRHLLKACASALRGRTNRYVTPENGHFSRNVQEIELWIKDGATLDGEIVSPCDGHPVRVRADRTVTFVDL